MWLYWKLQWAKNWKMKFVSYYFLNMDISLNIVCPWIKFDMILLHDIMEGTVSQIFDLAPSFYLMKSTKIGFIKWPSDTLFWHKIITLIKNLRHGSLHTNGIDPCSRVHILYSGHLGHFLFYIKSWVTCSIFLKHHFLNHTELQLGPI